MVRPVAIARSCAVGLLWLAATAATAATGEQVFATCAACHGLRGEGNPRSGAPALAGQHAFYLRRQLANFRAGLRGTHAEDRYGAQMRAANSSILGDDKAIAAVVAYIAALPPTTTSRPAPFDRRNGNNLYQGNCGACHGGRAEGNEAFATPRLAGLDAQYLTRQLANFRHGVRGAAPQDRYGKQMAMMAATLPGERDVADVIGYIQTAGAAK